MLKLKELVDSARVAFGRLSQREQLMALGGGGAGVVVLLLGLGLAVSSAIHRVEHRVKVKSGQLIEVMALQGAYRARQQEQQARMGDLRRSNVRLVHLVEEAAAQAGVNIAQLRPEDGEPSDEGIVESRVELRASGLSADRLQDFLRRLVQAEGIVILKRMKINRPYRKDTVDLELSVSTYKMTS
jgi:hypothetical protein